MGSKINKILLILMILLVAIFLFVFYIVKSSNLNSESVSSEEEFAREIFKYRTNDISDKENVDNILDNIKFDGMYSYQSHEIKTKNRLNKIIFYLNEDNSLTKNEKSDIDIINENLVMLFALIENLDEITFHITTPDDDIDITTQRRWINEFFQNNIYNEIKTEDDFYNLVKSFSEIDLSAKPKNYKDIQQVIEDAILKYNKEKFPIGEFAVEGHFTYDVYETMEYTKAYLYVKYSKYQFINDFFENIAEISSPVVITFSYDEKSGYIMKDYRETDDGAYYEISLHEMFPEDIIPKVKNHMNNKKEMDVIEQKIDKKITEYLTELGRIDYKVAKNRVEEEKKYPDIREENQMIFDALSQVYSDYPYFIGSLEKLENGQRMKYSMQKEETSEKKDVLTYEKIRLPEKTQVEKLTLEIEGGEIKVIEGKLSEEFTSFYKSLKDSQK